MFFRASLLCAKYYPAKGSRARTFSVNEFLQNTLLSVIIGSIPGAVKNVVGLPQLSNSCIYHFHFQPFLECSQHPGLLELFQMMILKITPKVKQIQVRLQWTKQKKKKTLQVVMHDFSTAGR